MNEDIQLPLRDDVRLLGEILGDTVREQVGEDIYLKVETQAQNRGISPETLINLWLSERLQTTQ